MPKLKNRLPKLCKNGDYAFVRCRGKKISLGRWGTAEAKQAYARFVAELQDGSLPSIPVVRSWMGLSNVPGESGGLVSELAVRYLEHVKTSNVHPTHYTHCKTLLQDFLLPIYSELPVNSFGPKCLKTVRNSMVASKRLCRNLINDYVRRIVAMFSFGVEEELCSVQTVAALREVKSLREGAAGTFDHPEREPVPDAVIRQTLPFLTPTLYAMVVIQWLTGLRPSEVCKMRAGQIDRESTPDLWVYNLSKHKTAKRISGRKIYLSEPVQNLLAPYLQGKKPDQFLFTPEQSERERRERQRAERKTRVQPSQVERAKKHAANPKASYAECYNQASYRKAIQFAIKRGNKILTDNQIPRWAPYQIRHSAATFIEETEGLDESQALLGHTSADMTKRYAKGQQAIQKRIALKQVNPFVADRSGD